MKPGSALACLALAAAVAGGMGWYVLRNPAPAATKPAGPPPVAVVAAAAEQRDVPIFLSGLGTVQAYNTVTVKPRVDGSLDKIAFVEGQDVKQGDLIAQIDPRPLQAQLDQAIAHQASDQAQLANAKLDLARFTNLATREFATRQSVDTQKAQVAQLEAALQGDQAAIDNARVQLGYTTITAPLSGRTGIRLVDQGNIVHASDTTGIVVITQLEPISLIFTLPQDNLPAISQAMAKGKPKVAAFASDEKTALGEGTLALIDNQIDQTTGTVRLKATFPNADHALWPGQFVNARLYLETRQGVTVPAPAVQRSAQGTFVYVIRPDSTVEARPVVVAQNRDGIALLDHGIAAGEKIVVDGQYKLRPGIRVAINGAAKPAAPAKS